jgi:hypothetical protein
MKIKINRSRRTTLALFTFIFLVFTVLLNNLPVYAEKQITGTAMQAKQTILENKQYLKDNYNILLPKLLTKGEFLNAVNTILQLEASSQDNKFTDLQPDSPYYKSALALYEKGILSNTTLQAERPLTMLDAVFITVKASDLKELAYTYPKSKISTALKKIDIDYGTNKTLTLQAAQLLALAVDTDIVSAEWGDSIKGKLTATDDFTVMLLEKILSFKGASKNYLGYVADKDIFNKVYEAWKTEDLIKAPELQAVFDTALKENLVTGYNLKDDRFTSHFDTKRSLTYGHDNITHTLQLIGLLRSEGINAKIQLEPKTSAFIYLKEWGEPVQTESYQVIQIDNGNFIAYAKEFDISLEFDSEGTKNKFHEAITKYAKKDSENEEGLIYSAWWQPLYYSLTEFKPFKVITNNKISKDHYYAQSFTLNDKSATLVAGIKKINPAFEVSSYPFWVDEPFYNYLLGGFK